MTQDEAELVFCNVFFSRIRFVGSVGVWWGVEQRMLVVGAERADADDFVGVLHVRVVVVTILCVVVSGCEVVKCCGVSCFLFENYALFSAFQGRTQHLQ